MAAFRRPESVLVVVHADRSVLLLRRLRPFDFWQSVTGSLERGESPRQAALRELAEETGLDGSAGLADTGVRREFVIDPRWRDRYAPGVTRNLEHEFRLSVGEPVPVRLDGTEHREYQWVDIDEAAALVWSSTNQAALTDLRGAL